MPENPPNADSVGEPHATTQLRMAKVIAQRKITAGSWSQLAKEIEQSIRTSGSAAPGDDKARRPIERRKLRAIAENDPELTLSLAELRTLDAYLEQFGHGLAYSPLFEKPELMRGLADSGRVDFLLGSKVDPLEDFRINISHWDVLGLSRIQARVLSFSQSVRVRIRELRMHENVQDAREEVADAGMTELFGDHGPSLVCIGSSRGNQMAEPMLCRMAGLKPFRAKQPGGLPELPFQFVWDSGRRYVLESAFHLDGEKAKAEEPSAGVAVLDEKAACFRHAAGYEIDELTREKNEGYTYALCVAQRRAEGQIWLLVAGLTGPATYAAAKWVNRMPTGLDDHKPGRPSRAYWNIVRSKAKKVKEGKRDTYHLEEAEVVTGGVVWG